MDVEKAIETVECATDGCSTSYKTEVTIVEGRKLFFPHCSKCAAERSDPEPEEAPGLTESEVRSKMIAAGVNFRQHGSCTIGSWEGSDGVMSAVRDFVTETTFADRWTPVQGLYLYGPTGVGKTHLAVATVRMCLGPKIRFERVASLITRIQDTYGTGGTGKIIEKLEKAELLVLDDLGAEKATPDVLRILTDLFSAREGHPTLITSNNHPSELVARYGSEWQRLESRLGSRAFRLIQIAGDDRRFQS